MSARAIAIWLCACSTRAAAARRSWLSRSASSTSATSAGSRNTTHHGESASEAGSAAPCCPRVVSGAATAGRRYLGPTAQPASSANATATAHRLCTLELSHGLDGRHARDRRAPEHYVEHRCQEEAEERHAEHAAEHGGAERLTHLGPRPGRARERQHAEDERERCHQDRPEAEPARLDCGGEAVLARLLLLLGELDDEHGVLRGEPDQRDEADLCDQVVVHAAQPRAEERERQAHRRDQDDREWQRPALVLGGMDEKDEEDTERKEVDRGVAG